MEKKRKSALCNTTFYPVLHHTISQIYPIPYSTIVESKSSIAEHQSLKSKKVHDSAF